MVGKNTWFIGLTVLLTIDFKGIIENNISNIPIKKLKLKIANKMVADEEAKKLKELELEKMMNRDDDEIE